MEYKELEGLQRQLLRMLIAFQRFTEENGLQMFLVGGSALGAYRHHGFIPWDDDVDIAMMRPDFEKMEQLLSARGNVLEGCIYSPVEHHVRSEAPIGFLYDASHKADGYAKAAKIDIHPIDGVPEGKFARKVQKMASLIYYLSIYRLPVKNKGKAVRTVSKLILKFTPDFLFRLYIKSCKKIMTSWSVETSTHICSLFGVAGYEREIMPINYLLPLVKTEFEAESFWLPGRIDPYLTRLYGDYKKLPDESERVPRHELYRYYQ